MSANPHEDGLRVTHVTQVSSDEVSICQGYGSPENGIESCGKEKDENSPWCEDCQDSADLDQRMERS